MVTPRIFDAWFAHLRASADRQGYGRLFTVDGRCCALGALCEAEGRTDVHVLVPRALARNYGLDRALTPADMEVLTPIILRGWASGSYPQMMALADARGTQTREQAILLLNDTLQLTFPEIVDVIERMGWNTPVETPACSHGSSDRC